MPFRGRYKLDQFSKKGSTCSCLRRRPEKVRGHRAWQVMANAPGEWISTSPATPSECCDT
ncbi:uncharacterized protein LY79DRAFT_569839 [Colletotrichum navitas]|uniref:Uncharacterized protein n=1 Tax=Colletotrichum navitas TaxID=681940 RepID=A0AAD8PMA3_9PEZI|nr:uncharacterized protein LY79DRAFT_569839 [Colletotrichum navitas]KAK1572725.1 hypothetical protein LY79DRAFT_569839 [Colletotrichum navitas]